MVRGGVRSRRWEMGDGKMWRMLGLHSFRTDRYVGGDAVTVGGGREE